MLKHINKIELQKRNTYAIMLLPALITLILLIIFPIIFLARSSLMKWDLSNPDLKGFIGFYNYKKFIRDPQFYHSMKITMIFLFGAVFSQIIIALAIAELISVQFKGRKLIQSMLILPMILPPVVIAVMWRMLFNPNLGVLNYIAESIFNVKINWLGSGRMALFSIVIVDIWQWTPFVLLMFLASYSAISNNLYEAAEVDGANKWQKFTHISLPLISPMITFATLFRMMEALRVFPKIFIMTMGGPGFATETLNFFTYRQAFTYSDIGYSSALGICMLIFSMVLIGAFYIISRRIT